MLRTNVLSTLRQNMAEHLSDIHGDIGSCLPAHGTHGCILTDIPANVNVIVSSIVHVTTEALNRHV